MKELENFSLFYQQWGKFLPSCFSNSFAEELGRESVENLGEQKLCEFPQQFYL